jgi:hypothetical protein
MKLPLTLLVLGSLLTPGIAQSTLTFQQGVAGYDGTQDTGVRSTMPDTNAGQWLYFGWDDNFLQENFTFQNGSAGYTSTTDTIISQAAATTDAGDWTYWGWDTDALGSIYPAYSLIKFGSVFGTSAGQIQLGSKISSASLKYSCFNTGDPSSVHVMNSSWAESTTWNSFNFLYASAATSTASGGAQGTCDLTQSIQSMSDGAPNYGWVLIPVTSGGVEAYSSEATAGPKPSLLVTTTDEDVAYSLIRFDNLIGSASWQIPPGSSVQSASLIYDVYNSGGLSEVHEMVTPWDESETWNSFQARTYSQQVLTTASGLMGQQSCDVTSSIQSYLDGATNRGWVFLPTNNDGVEIFSSEAAIQAQRPRLVVNLTAPDCNANGVPDLDDITMGTSFDCNGNGVPDECDLTSGYSTDIDSDGQLDDCVAPPLMADVYDLSVAAGGIQTLTLTAPTALDFYFLFGSTSGTSPGVATGGFVVPLNFDSYLLHTATRPNQAPLSSSFGVLLPLGTGGTATASFSLPPGFDPGLVGMTLHHAYVTIDLVSGNMNFVSNAVPLALLP